MRAVGWFATRVQEYLVGALSGLVASRGFGRSLAQASVKIKLKTA